MIFFFFLTIFLWMEPIATAGPCCGGGGQSALILNDDFFKLSIAQSTLWGVGEAKGTSSAIFWNSNKKDTTLATEMKVAWVPDAYFSELNEWLDSRFQLWGSTSILERELRHSMGASENFGMGDLRAGASWEIVTERVYHPFLPRIFFVSDFQFPAATSSVLGNERASSSLGIPLFKRLGKAQISSSVHYSWLGSSAGELKISLGAARSFLLPALSLGMNISHIKQLRTSNEENFEGLRTQKEYTECSFSGNYQFHSNMEFELSYMDQTLLGPARFAQLNRSLSAALVYKGN